ncbi:response regulator transcription factor [Lentzea sp. NPDC003310]|uniref:response regulator transcription factor n=1 Tax=Lentzea sp. NPDC003310 TaxID=3154447 RepID=UPI0033A925A5
MQPEVIRTVLAEDGALLREGLSALLDRFGFQVVAAVGDAEALVAAVNEHSPDLVVTDIRMPPGFSDEGLRATVRLREANPNLRVVALSQFVETSYASDLLDSGGGIGVGYLLKDRVGDVREFISILHRVANGETVVDPQVVRTLLKRSSTPLATLSNRELEVLGLIAEGYSNAGIAEKLVVSEAAVTKHIGNIFTKLGFTPGDERNRRVLATLTYLRDGAGLDRP